MIPDEFPEANRTFVAPKGLADSQVMPIRALVHAIEGGSMDGSVQVVVAWRPTDDELRVLQAGGLLYISMIGGLSPHYPSTSLYEATHPA